MRESKFRFWLGHTKKMTYAHPLIEVGKIVPEFTEDIIPLQYTGLKDKNGTEIYEGDVLYSRYDDTREEDGFGEILVPVCFQDGSFGWIGDITGKFHSFAEEPLTGYEVIGNIYQHPHLLTPTT